MGGAFSAPHGAPESTTVKFSHGLLEFRTGVGRWRGNIPAEERAELMTKVYEPLLRVLIQTKRRGQINTWKRSWHPG
jgi:hypothetical protein